MPHIYLDHASTTPLDPRVLKAMEPYFMEKFGNPGSLHSFGQEAIAAVDKSREIISQSIGAKFNEIIFTSSATEANNLALRGILKAWQAYNSLLLSSKRPKPKPRIIISAIEHESIMETARDLEAEGVEIVRVGVDSNGIINLKEIENALNEQTLLVSVMYGNNEIGTIQPIKEISALIKSFRTRISPPTHYSLLTTNYPLFHTDASQAFLYKDCNVKNLGVDLMTLSAHKLYGPKGVGALYVCQEVRSKKYEVRKNDDTKKFLSLTSYVLPLVTGGGQEYGLRSGTENVPAIVGFAKAVELRNEAREKETKRVTALRDYAEKKLQQIKNIIINGKGAPRLPHIINISFAGLRSEDIIINLDLNGIAVSSGPACASRSGRPSHVLSALQISPKLQKSGIRVSLGKFTSQADIDALLNSLKLLKQ